MDDQIGSVTVPRGGQPLAADTPAGDELVDDGADERNTEWNFS